MKLNIVEDKMPFDVAPTGVPLIMYVNGNINVVMISNDRKFIMILSSDKLSVGGYWHGDHINDDVFFKLLPEGSTLEA